jgi:hypothetical protein
MAQLNDMASLPDVKTFLNETTSNSDVVLAALITSVSQLIQDFTDCPFISATYDWFFSGYGSKTAIPPYGPVQQINYVNIDNISIPLVVASSNPYPNYGYTFDPLRQEVRLAGCRFDKGEQNCEINYTAGWANSATVSGQSIGTGNGANTTFQLANAAGVAVYPFTPAPTLYLAGVAQPATAYSISSTGVVTFATAPGNGVAVTWSGAYWLETGGLPQDLQYAVWSLVGWMWRNRNRQGKSSESVGGRMTAAYLSTWASPDVLLIIEHYARRNVG